MNTGVYPHSLRVWSERQSWNAADIFLLKYLLWQFSDPLLR